MVMFRIINVIGFSKCNESREVINKVLINYASNDVLFIGNCGCCTIFINYAELCEKSTLHLSS